MTTPMSCSISTTVVRSLAGGADEADISRFRLGAIPAMALEQQQTRARGQARAKFDALLQAIRQLAHDLAPHALQPQKLDDALGAFVAIVLFAARARQAQHLFDRARTGDGHAAHHDVVEHAHPVEEREILKRTPDAQARQRAGAQFGVAMSGEGDAALLADDRARVLMMLSNDVLPAPFGPMMARISPSATVRSTPASATTPPKDKSMPSSASSGAGLMRVAVIGARKFSYRRRTNDDAQSTTGKIGNRRAATTINAAVTNRKKKAPLGSRREALYAALTRLREDDSPAPGSEKLPTTTSEASVRTDDVSCGHAGRNCRRAAQAPSSARSSQAVEDRSRQRDCCRRVPAPEQQHTLHSAGLTSASAPSSVASTFVRSAVGDMKSRLAAKRYASVPDCCRVAFGICRSLRTSVGSAFTL